MLLLILVLTFIFSYSDHECPFSLGVTLAKLAAVTTDETGKETFDTSGVLDKLRKVQYQPLVININLLRHD